MGKNLSWEFKEIKKNKPDILKKKKSTWFFSANESWWQNSCLFDFITKNKLVVTGYDGEIWHPGKSLSLIQLF